MKDFYYILGTDVDCSSVEINEAYRKLSKKFHPELNQNDSYFQNRFNEIYEAYDVLSDPYKRSRYDKELKKLRENTSATKHKLFRYIPKSKNIDIAFTVIFVIITFIFGVYVMKAISGSKIKKAPQVAEVNPISLPKIKHHKRKHGFAIKTINNTPDAIPDTVKIRQVTKAVPNDNQHYLTEPVNNNTSDNFRTDNRTNTNSSTDILYTTYIKANETGVVNMRASNYYNSDIIKVIPNNSKVSVLEKGNLYYKILFDDAAGYVPRWAVQQR